MLIKAIAFAIILLSSINSVFANDTLYQNLAFDMLNIVAKKSMNNKMVKVAIVDDGFRLSHKVLKNYVFKNENEILNNFRDDDKNGYIDDVTGWDVSDNDNNVGIIEGRESEFQHGTYIASIVIKVFERYYGEDAPKYLRIIPVKVLSDHSKSTYLKDGYKGIEYASKIGADIICCAWSGGEFGRDEKAILDEALSKGQIIVSSAGNFFTEDVNYPAKYDGVIAVSGVDINYRKIQKANYDMRVDICAPGDSIFGAYPSADNAFIYSKGTSPATAFIAGCIAILKSLNYSADTEMIKDALFLTAKPIDEFNLTYAGKLGAGFPNMENAVEYILNPGFKYSYFNEKLPEGKVLFGASSKIQTRLINPVGEYRGIHILPTKIDNSSKLKIYSNDSVFYEGKTNEFKTGLYIENNAIAIESGALKGKKNSTEISYFVQTIDSTKLFCNDVVYINSDSGIITDGSGENNYANKSVCKWIITASENKRIKLDFTKMHTEPNVDFVYIYDGDTSLKENLLAQFSGANKPPIITSNTNRVMIWFLSNDFITGNGWELKFEAVESIK
jgi:serine protease